MRKLDKLRPIIGIGIALCVSFAVWSQVSVQELSHEWTVQPGGTVSGTIAVVNSGDEPHDVDLSQFDYTFASDGRYEYLSPGEVLRSNAGWITFQITSSHISIPARSTLEVPYTIQVPDDPGLIGTYWSVVQVRILSPTEQPVAQKAAGVLIRHVISYAIQIVTHIGDTGTHDISIIGSQLSETDDELSFEVDIENTGERWVRPVVSLEIYTEEGDFVGRFESQSGKQRVYPGTSVRHRISLPGLEPGKYPAMLYIDNLDEYVWAAQVTIEVQ